MTSALGPASAAAILSLLARLRATRRLALVLVSHETDLIAAYTGTVHLLRAGRVGRPATPREGAAPACPGGPRRAVRPGGGAVRPLPVRHRTADAEDMGTAGARRPARDAAGAGAAEEAEVER
ncbi:hypothetical protein ACH4FX_31075 [Streptomyces sp. NPDC018019]|uniref:hypothetical protein n=1 Tax=Streptomyces sp. NPDC018019 TaxID=3365030 RepID=UPI00378B23E3